jgi:RNA 2',3'-cyclic 3'-phosphodiesterase
MTEEKKLRLFIAIELPRNIQESLSRLQEAFKETEAVVKWTNSENIHLTLKFLGYLKEDLLNKIKEVIKEVASTFPSFRVTLSREMDAFPGKSRPRVLWVGINEGKDEITHLQQKLEDGLEGLGLEKEKREFKPHLTLGRIKSLKSKEGLLEEIKKARLDKEHTLRVIKICLFKSTLTPGGPVYDIIYEASLK